MGKNTSVCTIDYSKNIKPLTMVFENSINICLCSSDAYAAYCGITLQSIIYNSSSEDTYDILIMEWDMTDRNKLLILSLIDGKDNFSIRFINMTKAMHDIKIGTWAHFSPVACFKLFLFSKMFANYDKFLVTDTDLVFARDPAALYSIDISDYYMAAVDDVIMKEHIVNNRNTSGFAPTMSVVEYLEDYLGMGTSSHYYNTGVVLLNIKRCREKSFLNIAIEKLKTKGYTYQEQDVLNELTVNHVLGLALNWNLVGTEQSSAILEAIPEETGRLYQCALDDPYIVHFAGGQKPWTHNNVPYGEYFFKYAKITPWYESILTNITLNYTRYVRNELYATTAMALSPRAIVKKTVKVLFPSETLRGRILRWAFPRGRGIREWLRIWYNRRSNRNPQEDTNKKEQDDLYNVRKVYFSCLKKSLWSNVVLLDSKNGTDLAGNILRLLVELNSECYGNLRLCLAYQKKNLARISAILKRYGLEKVTLIEWRSPEYFEYLGRSKYLITDLYVVSEYIKRSGQILISTAHGTPIKTMGRDCHTETQGHLQRTHILADYQIFPSNYMKEKLFRAFMEDDLFSGIALRSGYCRNDIFFDSERRGVVRQELNFDGKIVYAYLPTFRGIAGDFKSQQQNDDVMKMCEYLDDHLPENYILLIKMHNFNASEMDFSGFEHIQEFPQDYEVYDVLNATDGLISDYSSVFFDYANLRKKIILFQYDFEQYMEERGVYLKWSDVPFPVVNRVEDLCCEMQSEKNYDDTAFLEKYCTYDNPNSSELVCRSIFKKEECCEVFPQHQRKKNIVIHIGNADLRSPTTFFVWEYLKHIDTTKYNYILYFYEYDLFNRAYMLENIPSDVKYISYLGNPDFTKHEHILYKKKRLKKIQNAFQRECQRCFSDLPIDLYIDLSGRILHVAEIAKNLHCKKVIVRYEGDNIISENCYQKYDVVVPIKKTIDNSMNTYQFVLGYDTKTIKENAKTLEELSTL